MRNLWNCLFDTVFGFSQIIFWLENFGKFIVFSVILKFLLFLVSCSDCCFVMIFCSCCIFPFFAVSCQIFVFFILSISFWDGNIKECNLQTWQEIILELLKKNFSCGRDFCQNIFKTFEMIRKKVFILKNKWRKLIFRIVLIFRKSFENRRNKKKVHFFLLGFLFSILSIFLCSFAVRHQRTICENSVPFPFLHLIVFLRLL